MEHRAVVPSSDRGVLWSSSLCPGDCIDRFHKTSAADFLQMFNIYKHILVSFDADEIHIALNL
jgi:hypothetical protein